MRYNHQKSFDDFGFIDWTQGNKNVSMGDFVFIYSTNHKRIQFWTVVEKSNLTYHEIRDDKNYWNPSYYQQYESYKSGLYCRLRLLSHIDDPDLSYKSLKSLGVDLTKDHKINPNHHMRLKLSNNEHHADEVLKYTEGNSTIVKVNKYERNRSAREACLEHYGYDCQVCKMNFEKVYGDIGKNFIHVHHIVPLSTIAKTYEVDPIKDLIPVCPNCHEMIHRLSNNDMPLSIDALRQILKK